jgi:hypothetical protein
MPFTEVDAIRHNGILKDKANARAQWVAVANSVLKKCMDDGGDDASCAPKAIRQANGVVAANDMHIHMGGAKNYAIREEQLGGRTHIIVPVIMMKEGVHSGSHGPILHLAEELGKFPGAWDGIPVSIQHPQEDGMHVSANQPHILDEFVVGRVFNTMMDGQKLKAEAWLDPVVLKNISPEAMEYIMHGKPLDVSVGVFTDEDMRAGEWNGEKYEAVARNHRPDHLALLPVNADGTGGTGACSWSDGCGVRAYHEGAKNMTIQANAIKFEATESIPWTKPTLADFGKGGNWATMDPADKTEVANHFLIGDDAAANFGELMFPVVNPKSGKLNEQALRAVIGGRGAQANISSAQRISARRQAYRLLNSEFDAKLDVPAAMAADIAVNEWEGLKEIARQGLSVLLMSHGELSRVIQAKLDRMDDDAKVNYLEDIFDGYIIYRVEARGNSQGTPVATSDGKHLFKRNYTVGQDGAVEFTGESMPVIKRVSFDPISRQGEVRNMSKQPCCEEKVQMLIESGLYAETDRNRLLAMEEADINVLSASVERHQAQVNAEKEKVTALEKEKTDLQANAAAQTTRDKAIEVLKEDLGDKDKFLALAPKEIRSTLEHGLRLHQDERNRQIAHIMANTNEGVYTKERLEVMPDQDLEFLAKAIKAPVDYSGQAPTPPSNGNRSPQGYADQAVIPPDVS